MDLTDQRKNKNKQTNRRTPTTNPPQPTKPNQSTTTTAWSSQHHNHQPPIRFSQHPPARLQIFSIIFSALRPHGLHNQNLEDQPLICSPLVEIGCKVLSGDEIFRLEKAYVRSTVCGGEEGRPCELRPWSYSGENFEIRGRFHPWRLKRERERKKERIRDR